MLNICMIFHVCVHILELLSSSHDGALLVHSPMLHVLVTSPNGLYPTLQVYVATVPFSLVPFKGPGSYSCKAPLSMSSGKSSGQNATKMKVFIIHIEIANIR